jgi:4-amino-4-deoxy-L-arabinose transferase-like glycosyltransferase
MAAPPSRSGSGSPPASLIAVVGVTLALRLAVGGLTHLTEDEAYYRLWSFAPAFGYFDHPPMIAWWIWLGRQVAGDTALGVRLLPILASAAASFLVFDMARLAGAARDVAGRAGIWFNAALLVLAGGFLAVPDAAASLFWALTLWCALRAKSASAWWLSAGLAAGLACLSKYSALFIGPGMFLWLVASPEGRRTLKTPGPWLALVVAAAVFAANVAWNASHGWLTFAKQFGRIAPHAFAPRYLVEFLLGQALLLNPLLAAFMVRALARRRPGGLDLAPFVLVSAPFAAYLVIHSLHDRVQAHWPAPLYPAAAILAASAADAWPRLARWVAPVGFSFGVLLLALLAAPGSLLGRYDGALPIRGWKPFAARITALQAATGAAWVGTSSYGLAAELADEPSLTAPVVQLAERDRWRDLPRPAAPDLSKPGLAIDLTRRLTAADLRGCFREVTPLGTLTRGDPGEAGKAYAAFRVAGPTRDMLKSGCWGPSGSTSDGAAG